MSKVLGIDPALNKTGWGIVETQNSSLSLLDCGLISNKLTLEISEKLLFLHENISEMIDKFHPTHIALEKTFVNKNPLSSLNLGYSRAIILLLSAKHQTPIFEYSPNSVKKAITGHGHATKEQVNYMIERLLNIKNNAKLFDISDAISVAICHINTNQTLSNIK